MKTYLVGGAVRDKLLNSPGHESADRDWVVVGSSIQAMLDAGYHQVGKDFPVFLHPDTKEEYALARTERKSGKGYTGFDCISDSSITLEEDLLRRDLTINAIAQTPESELIDPYGGVDDINNRILRHVSQAFTEDPLRVLRVARFAARFHSLGFSIADETLALMKAISDQGELEHLIPERVWKETEKALQTDSPHIYFQTLRECNSLKVLFPEIDCLFGVPQTEKHHPEIDTGIHTLMVLEQAARLSPNTAIRFAALTHDLGKGITPESKWPKHIAHEHTGVKLVKKLCKRLRVPNDCSELALQVCEYHLHSHRAFELKPSTIQKLFKSLDLYRKPERFEQFLIACEADMRGRKGFENNDYPQREFLNECSQVALGINSKTIDTGNLSGKEIGLAIDNERTQAIAQVKKANKELQGNNHDE